MKKITLTLTALLLCLLTLGAQNLEKQKAENYLDKQGELTFTFQISDANTLKSLENLDAHFFCYCSFLPCTFCALTRKSLNCTQLLLLDL